MKRMEEERCVDEERGRNEEKDYGGDTGLEESDRRRDIEREICESGKMGEGVSKG